MNEETILEAKKVLREQTGVKPNFVCINAENLDRESFIRLMEAFPIPSEEITESILMFDRDVKQFKFRV